MSVMACGHPAGAWFRFREDGACGACLVLAWHALTAGGACDCRTCEGIRSVNDLEPAARSRWLKEIAETLADEAVSLYEAAGSDAVDLTRFVGALVGAPSLGDDFDRSWALHTMPYPEFLMTPEWAEQRRRARVLAGDRCQGCNSPDHLETHHRTYENRGFEFLADLTVLCAACHTAVHLVMDGRRGKVRATSRRALL